MKFEAGKIYKMRNGRKARVYATDGGGILAIHGAWRSENGAWYTAEWPESGIHALPEMDLMTPKCEAWMNIYGENVGGPYQTRSEADSTARHNRIACIRIEYEEGEGL